MRSILTFIGGFLVIHILLSISLNYLGEPEDSTYKKKDELFDLAPSGIDYLFLGNSRTNAAIDSSYFDNSFNYAHSGEFYWQMYYRLNHILTKEEKTIKTVILPAELGSGFLNYNRLETDGYYWRKRMNFLEMSKAFNNDLGLMSIVFLIKVFPYYRFFAYKVSIPDNEDEENEEQAQKPRELRYYNLSPADKRKEVKDKLDQVTSRINSVNGGDFFLEKTIQLCLQHDVQPVFVKYPMTRTYKTAITEFIQDMGHDPKQTDLIIDQYDAVLIDITSGFQNNDRMFSNPTHLNKEGSRKYSQRLAKVLSRENL